MLHFIMDGDFQRAIILLIVIVISLTFHEFGHAWSALKFGDDTAMRQGRLTLNPAAHIDPFGLLLVALVGFGFAKPVPTNPRNFNSVYASLWVSAAGPGMNLLLAFVSINLLAIGWANDIEWLTSPGVQFFLLYMTNINLILMLFNLMPIGPLDGHYILPYFLSRENAHRYMRWNDQYGTMVLMSAVVLSMMGLPIFSFLMGIAQTVGSWLVIV